MHTAIKIITADVFDGLRQLPDESVHCVVTSPPYWGLRDYGTGKWEGGDPTCSHTNKSFGKGRGSGQWFDGGAPREIPQGRAQLGGICSTCGATRIDKQIGQEETLSEHIDRLVAVFREVRRVLRKDGTVWFNYGDAYAGSWGNQGRKPDRGTQRPINGGMISKVHDGRYPDKGSNTGKCTDGYKAKDLMMMPARLAIALQEDGWWIRSEIIWHKPNPMPESVTDRPTSAHEKVYLLSKSARYFYDADAVRERAVAADISQMDGGAQKLADGSNANKGRSYIGLKGNANGFRGGSYVGGKPGPRTEGGNGPNPTFSRNLRNVWTIATSPFPEAHFATFPPKLAETCIKAGTSEHGCCSKCGASWIRLVERPSAPPEVFTKRHRPSDELISGFRVNGEMVGGGGKLQKWRDENPSRTVGWRPSCKCEAGAVPCVVLDPFSGSGTTGMVAARLGRSAILIELNPGYVEMAKRRIAKGADIPIEAVCCA